MNDLIEVDMDVVKGMSKWEKKIVLMQRREWLKRQRKIDKKQMRDRLNKIAYIQKRYTFRTLVATTIYIDSSYTLKYVCILNDKSGITHEFY